MLPELPAEGLVRLFHALVLVTVRRIAMVLALAVGGVAVLLVEGLGLFTGMALAGNRGKEESGGGSGEEGGRFHAGADVAHRRAMASQGAFLFESCGAGRSPRPTS